MKPLLSALLIAGAVALFGAAGCESTKTSTTTSAASHAPKWNGEVKDTDTCQPVREKKIGGVSVICKGTCPNKTSKCGTLQARKKGTEQPWKDQSQPADYDAAMEYRCVCRRG